MTGTWQSFCMLHIIRMAFLWADTESAKKAFEIWSFVFVWENKPPTQARTRAEKGKLHSETADARENFESVLFFFFFC